MTLTEKTAYLKGMMEGMKFNAASDEGRLLAKIVEILDDMALEVDDLENQVDAIDDFTDELAEYAEQIDDDLTDLEDLVLDEEEEDDWDDEDDYDEDEEEEDDYVEDEDDEDYDGYETECPVCGKTVYFTDEDDPEDVVCPSCGEHFSCVCDGNCSDCGDPCPARDEEKE